MKKLIALILVLVLSLSLAACGGGETATKDDELLPFGLRFGMTYDEVKEVCEALPELTPATANDGYITGTVEFETEDIEAYLADVFKADSEMLYGNIEDGAADTPAYAFSYNENKELYELYLFMSFMGESKSEYFFNHFCDFFDERLGTEAEINETDSRLTANYETETLGVSVMLQVEESGFSGFDFTQVCVILHDKTHELSE